MATPAPSDKNPKNPLQKNAKKNYGPELNRGPAQKPDRSRTLPGARRVNKTQGR